MENNTNNINNIPMDNAYIPPAATVDWSMYTPKPREYFTLGKKDFIFSVLALILCVFGVSATFWGGFKLGFSISVAACFALVSAYLINKKTRIKPYALCCGALAVAGMAVFSLTLNTAVNFWLCVVIFCLSAVWFDSLGEYRPETGDLGLIKNIIVSTFGTAFPCLPQSVGSIFKSSNSKLRSVLLGLLCALPVLFVILPLLINSDAAFEGLILNLFGDLATAIFKLVLGLAVTPLLIAYGFGLAKTEKQNGGSFEAKGINTVGLCSFLSAISLCYLTYLFSQLAYFFSAFSGILPDDFKVADYARRGFFEMVAIATINFLIVFLSLIFVEKKDGKTNIAVKLITAFICLFTLIIAGTAISKMLLYIDSFGMTRLRILTTAFMLLLGVVFIALIFRCFIKKIPVLRVALVSAAVILLVLGFGNVDRLVAEYNVSAYLSGELKEIDIETVYDMGESGVPYLVLLRNDKNSEVRLESRYYIRMKIDDLYDVEADENNSYSFEKRYNTPAEWNYSRDVAYGILDKFLKNYDKLPQFLEYESYDAFEQSSY